LQWLFPFYRLFYNFQEARQCPNLEFALKTPDGRLNLSRAGVHPERTIDVAVVRMDDIAMEHQNKIRQHMTMKVLTMDRLEPFTNLPGAFGYIGTQVFALGYPSGITSLLTSHDLRQSRRLAVCWPLKGAYSQTG
jgi:hypothetical protein